MSYPDVLKEMRIVPYEKVGPFKFGMSQSKVRELLGEPTRINRHKCSPDGLPADVYWYCEDTEEPWCIFIWYRKPGVLQAMEFSTGADVHFRAKRLLSRSMTMKEACDHLAFHDKEVKIDKFADGTIYDADSVRFGLRLWSEAGEPDEPVSAILVHDRSYLEDSADPEKLKTQLVTAGLLEKEQGGDE